MSNHGTAGKRKHTTLMIPQTVGFIQHWIINCLLYKETVGPIMNVVKWECEGPFQATDIETAKISKIGQGIVQVVYSNVL